MSAINLVDLSNLLTSEYPYFPCLRARKSSTNVNLIQIYSHMVGFIIHLLTAIVKEDSVSHQSSRSVKFTYKFIMIVYFYSLGKKELYNVDISSLYGS